MIELRSRPTVFIGSSSEGKTVAEYLSLALNDDFEIQLWSQGVFGIAQSTLDELIKTSRECEYAVLIFTPDDIVTKRNTSQPAPRDNVLFELGLFMGRLGRDKVFIVQERESNVSMPSDLAGVTTARYTKPRNNNWQSALAPCALKIRDAVMRIESASSSQPISDIVNSFKEEDIRNIVRPVLTALRDALAWSETFDNQEMFHSVQNQILGDIRRIGRRRLTFRPPHLWEHWYSLVRSLDASTQEVRLVSNNDIKYWLEAMGGEESEAHSYATALRDFRGTKARTLIIPKKVLLDSEQAINVTRIVEDMTAGGFRVRVVLEEDLRQPPDPYPRIWKDFGIIGDLAVSFFDWDDQEDVSRSLIESFDAKDMEKARRDWETLLTLSRWDSGESGAEPGTAFANWLLQFRSSKGSRKAAGQADPS